MGFRFLGMSQEGQGFGGKASAAIADLEPDVHLVFPAAEWKPAENGSSGVGPELQTSTSPFIVRLGVGRDASSELKAFPIRAAADSY